MLFTTNVVFSQDKEKMEEEYVLPITLIKDGKEIEGYVSAGYTEDGYLLRPWYLQEELRFIDKDVFDNTEKIRRRHYDKIKPKDADGFRIDSLVFVSMRYGGGLGTDLIPRKIFIKQISEDYISLFEYYETPDALDNAAKYRKNPVLIYRRGKDGKLKTVASLLIKRQLKDCPEVIKKYENGEYNVDKERGKFFNHIKNDEQIRLNALMDYNKICGKKE